MNKKRLKEFKDDAESDKAVDSVTSSLKNLLKFVNNTKDFSRLMESVMKWMIKNKQQLGSIETNSNFKQVMIYLNKMQSEEFDNKASQKPITQK